MLSENKSNGEDENLPHPISLLNMSRGHSLHFRSWPEAFSVEESSPPPESHIITSISCVTFHLASSSTSSPSLSGKVREPPALIIGDHLLTFLKSLPTSSSGGSIFMVPLLLLLLAPRLLRV